MRVGLSFLFLLLLLSVFSASADVYRWVDADGRVMYGDNPPKKSGAKTVELPPLTVADPPAATPASEPPAGETAGTGQEAEAYSDFKVTSPTPDDAVRSNDGSLTVTLSLKPQLKPGDGLVVYLDAKQVAAGASLSFPLTGVERGEHTVFAVLNDAAGNIIQNTQTVKFNVLRHSVLN
jgi:hypothetical protein